MNKLYLIIVHKKKILTTLIFLTLIFGIFGYVLSPKIDGFEVINKSISLFAFDWIEENNSYLIIAHFLAILSVFFTVVILFLKDTANLILLYLIQKKPYTLVVGLGEQNSAFLKSLQSSSAIIVEADKNNPKIDYFKQKNFAVIENRIEESLKELNLKNLSNAIISTADGSLNISIASLLAKELKCKDRKKIFVRVENRDLSVLFRQNVVKSCKNADIAVYSLYENIAKKLFERHSILGNMRDIIKTNEEFAIAVVGDSALCAEIIYHIAILSNLPNQNTLKLYLVDKNAKSFYKRLKKLFWNIDKIKHIDIALVERDSDSFEFYADDVWRSKNLTNIIIATDDRQRNLDIAINLQDSVFIQDIVKGKFKTKVLFAADSDKGLFEEIDEDKELFANFFAFGNIEEVSSKENLIDEKLDLIAKSIHYLYKEIVYDPNFLITDENKEEVERRWHDIKMFSDKLSNKMQALHINTKLLALNLSKRKSNKDKRELLKINKEIFFKRLGSMDIKEDEILDFSKKLSKFYTDEGLDTDSLPKDLKPLPLPKKYESMFEKLIRSEHNRWMTYHYLNGWEYGKKDKRAKTHNCLVDFKKLTYTVIFDIYSVIYIPNILASAGYELINAGNGIKRS